MIVAAVLPAIRAAQQATKSVPIVMAVSADPVGAGFVASLARPGANITGLSNIGVDVSSKYIEFLRIAVPTLSRVAVLVNPSHPNHAGFLKTIQDAARTTGVVASSVRVSSAGEIESAFDAMRRERAEALSVLPDSLFILQGGRIAQLAATNRLPTMFWSRELADAGGLMSYGQDLVEQYRRAATYVDKILKGANPADLPVEQATKFELVINRKTAKAIGLSIPQELVFRADKVIE